MSGSRDAPMRRHLRVVQAGEGFAAEEFFCGHCGASAAQAAATPVGSRVCARCNLGLVLHAPGGVAPAEGDTFLVVDVALRVCGLSRDAEKLLRVREPEAVGRHLEELLVLADVEDAKAGSLALRVVRAAHSDGDVLRVHVRPPDVFGVRFEATIGPCGPGPAALLVLR